ncbi:cell wall hydrolase [Paenibacillus glacialis]|uniref:Cell wall hydrolase SleB domain-containing protein n=1 Tax=Paenibacillus glacialis TaxID=494026 RepID=A0A168P0E6_9BACL|nr:cell wall hydrolase [Paenibacillus glacialis]OAB46269.1 hypothetical protein PGLA_02500 [Paenibacillus glacialis]
MNLIRQNRWVALLIGVILVCFSAICLLLQIEEKQAIGKLYKQVGINGTEIHSFKPLLMYTIEDERPFHVLGNNQQLVTKQQEVASTSVKSIDSKKVVTEKVEQINKSTEVNSRLNPPKALFFTRTQMLSQNEKEHSTWQYTVSDKELLLLRKIVMAEAEGEPYQGKVAVANVVLNRLRSANFPKTIHKVIYQKYQFSPVANGRLDRVKPSDDTIHAVNEALNGHKAVSDDTYYFLSLKLADDLTVHNTRTFSKTIGNHSFYK